MGRRKRKRSQRRNGNGELTRSVLGGFDVPVRCSLVFVLTDPRWEEERYTDGVKWKFLEHKGPVFAPPYDPLPNHVHFFYDGT